MRITGLTRLSYPFGGGGVAVAVVPTVALYRDAPLLDLIAAAVAGTKEFDLVTTHGLPEAEGVGADLSAVAVLELSGFESDFDTLGDDYDLTPQLHTASFTVTLIVRDQDLRRCRSELDRLRSVVKNVINKQSFGDVTVPMLTCLLRGTYQPHNGVEQRLEIEGQLAYYLDDWTLHNEDVDQ